MQMSRGAAVVGEEGRRRLERRGGVAADGDEERGGSGWRGRADGGADLREAVSRGKVRAQLFVLDAVTEGSGQMGLGFWGFFLYYSN